MSAIQVPGMADLKGVPAEQVRKTYRPYASARQTGAGLQGETPLSVYRNTTLLEALTAALDHIRSRCYGSDHSIVLSDYLRHCIETEFENAIGAAFESQRAANSAVEITTAAPDPDDRSFPVYRCTDTGMWTMVVRDARIRVKPSDSADGHTVQVDFLRVDIADGTRL